MKYYKEDDFKNDVAVISQLANDVFHELGPGYAEAVYQKALAVEFREHQMVHEMESVIPILYHGMTVGSGRADFVLYPLSDKQTKVVIELKAVSNVPGEAEIAQLRTYLTAAKLSYGMVINFPQSFKNGRSDVDVKTYPII